MPDAPAATTTVIDRSGEQELRNKIAELTQDNAKYRRQLRQYKELGTVDELKKRLPADGSVVISAEDAKVLEKYRGLGKPEDLEKAMQERDELKGEVAKQKHQQSLAACAEAAQLNAKALAKVPGIDSATLEVKKEKVDGQDVDVAYITEAKQGATPQKLNDWLEANHSELMPALQADAADQQDRKQDTTRDFPRQRPARSGNTKEPTVEEIAAAQRQSGMYGL